MRRASSPPPLPPAPLPSRSCELRPRWITKLLTATDTPKTWISSITTGWLLSVRTALITLPLSNFGPKLRRNREKKKEFRQIKKLLQSRRYSGWADGLGKFCNFVFRTSADEEDVVVFSVGRLDLRIHLDFSETVAAGKERKTAWGSATGLPDVGRERATAN